MPDLEAFVGVDVGGTHTDVQVIAGDREARGKALTTYDDFSRGVLGAIEVAAEELGMSLDDLLGSTQLLVNATTVVTNAITQLRGAKVGVLVTKGFPDEFRFGGGPRSWSRRAASRRSPSASSPATATRRTRRARRRSSPRPTRTSSSPAPTRSARCAASTSAGSPRC
jgi:N-methylhydantoinase A/oxoprolinase/acetone carboxylase beta subunit